MGVERIEDLLVYGEEYSFYGLWKQGTVGDNNTPRPFWLFFNDCRRWDEWNALEGTTRQIEIRQRHYFVRERDGRAFL
ncbi:BQ2448_1466 [Microbotryum intermedium]|uniref:BQ2448_1466 protein n=1 Tax=Microbotryum intermedium TaxID=269621 RepID=A0A238F877_9BASI|nr:BQ2448_1466 [Microbotryum intermedium]